MKVKSRLSKENTKLLKEESKNINYVKTPSEIYSSTKNLEVAPIRQVKRS
jgi:hypothetical protein